MKLKDWHLLLIIYAVALSLTLINSINQPIISDQLIEYKVYLSQIESGKWQYIINNIVNSCPVATFIPAIIQRITHVNAEILFHVYPSILFAFMPVFVYLIARKFYDIRYALLAPLIVLFNYYFIYSGNIGRISIAWAIFTGIVWAFLKQKNLLFLILMILLVFTHYGTAVIALASFSILTFAMIFYKSDYKGKIWMIGIMVAVILLVVVWYFVIAKESGKYVERFIINSINQPTQSVSSNTTQDKVVMEALGTNTYLMNIAQKIELIMSWIVTFMIIGGFLISFKTKQIKWEYTVLSVIMFNCIQATILSPFVGVHYGVTRMYFTALPILAVYYIVTVDYLFKKHKIIGLSSAYMILILYGLCTSGIMHRMFGIIK